MVTSCRDKDLVTDNEILNQYLNLPDNPYDYASSDIPDYLDKDLILKQDNQPVGNEITNNGATLGRVLFYDKHLSANGTTACASCHKQSLAFGDSSKLSVGHLGGFTGRHSMGLSNARFRAVGIFFWDGRAASLEDQVLMPFQDPVEMGLTLDQLVAKVEEQPYYPILFKRAFGSEEITSEKISRALAQFVRSITSFNSRYDQGRKNHKRLDDFSNFTAEENLGKQLFFDVKKGNCGGCHLSDAFVMDVPRNNGLDVWESPGGKDIGYQKTSGDPLDMGKFIAPSLRNIGIRPPYMHDGRFSSLEDVVNHYSENIQWSSTLDRHLFGTEPNTAVRFNLSVQEKAAMVAFLKTLTDESLTTDPRFSSPF